MASHLVDQHQQSSFATPQNDDPGDATVVLGNDNATVATYNAHDADATIHVQSSSAAVFNATPAGTEGRKWLTQDAGAVYLYYDNGSAWVEVNYLRNTGGTVSGAVTISSGGLTVSAGTTAVQALMATTGTFTGLLTVASGIVGTNDTILDIDSKAGEASGIRLQRSGGTGGVKIYAGSTTTVNADFSDAGALTMRAGIAATTGTFSGAITANAGATVASGQTLTLTGATVAGSPTWSASQAITLSTASQPNITTLGGLTSVSTLVGLGGTTSSFPALKRSSTTIEVRLADDSAYANLTAKIITANDTSNPGTVYALNATTMALTLTTNPALSLPITASTSSLSEGMLWYDGTNLKFRIAGSVTKTITWS